MAHYAKVLNKKVTNIIVAEEEFFSSFVDTEPGEWIQCSYNNNIRGVFPGVGFEYNKEHDIFVAPKPYESWILDVEKARYKAPKDYPDDGKDYKWDEDSLDWVETQQTKD